MRITLILLLFFSFLLSGVSYARSKFTLPASESLPLYALTIRTTPTHSTVKIMNVKVKYHHGMKLQAGDYRLEISAQGYRLKKHIVRIRYHDKNIRITLRKNNVIVESHTHPVAPSSSSPHATADFISTTKGYIRFLRHANRLKGISFTDQKQQFEKYCRRYANLSVQQAKRRIHEGCATNINFFKNDTAHQWSLQKKPQKAWCKTVSAYATAKEATYRELRLKACLMSKNN
jgi:hypothetical protein